MIKNVGELNEIIDILEKTITIDNLGSEIITTTTIRTCFSKIETKILKNTTDNNTYSSIETNFIVLNNNVVVEPEKTIIRFKGKYFTVLEVILEKTYMKYITKEDNTWQE